jgi:hypothetical protein
MVVACLALFVASTGTSIAASHYLITSTKQIKPSVLTKLKGAKGSNGSTGAEGGTGATGATGGAGSPGPSGVVTTATFSGGGITPISAGASAPVFASSTATVTTTASQRLTGAAWGALSSTGAQQTFIYGLCYQASTGGTITFFSPVNSTLTTTTSTYADAASVVPGAGTWTVGYCVFNPGSSSLDRFYGENGWVQVTN